MIQYFELFFVKIITKGMTRTNEYNDVLLLKAKSANTEQIATQVLLNGATVRSDKTSSDHIAKLSPKNKYMLTLSGSNSRKDILIAEKS